MKQRGTIRGRAAKKAGTALAIRLRERFFVLSKFVYFAANLVSVINLNRPILSLTQP
jgi:hypothetical protein